MTVTAGVILWFRMDRHIADAIFKAAPKIRSKECQIRVYVPDIARGPKRFIDKILIEYKTERDPQIPNKNTTNDLEVLVKSTASNREGPYRRIDPGMLGVVPQLKLSTVAKVEGENLDPSTFITVSAKKRKKFGS